MTTSIYSGMITKFRSERTINGFGIDVMKSGLQKYIRRRECDKALYCAGELDLFKHVEGGEKIRANMIHRLMIIFMEDIGLGGIELWPTIDSLIAPVISVRKRPMSSRNANVEADSIAQIVVLMCKSEKARTCSHLRAISKIDNDTDLVAARYYPDIYKLRQSFVQEMKTTPDRLDAYITKLETSLRKRSWLAVWWANQIADSSKTTASVIFDTISKVIDVHFPYLQHFVPIAVRWYRELKTVKESFLCWLLLINAIIQIDSSKAHKAVNIERAASVNGWALNISGHKMRIDDYVFDIHTKSKQHHKRSGLAQFAEHGALVVPESEYVIQRFKKFYEDMKRYSTGGISLINEAYCARIREDVSVEIMSQSEMTPQSEMTSPSSDHDYDQDIEITLDESQSDMDISIDTEDTATTTASTIPRESQAYRLFVRAQVNTSASKQDVYFATESDTGRFVVVKGPYAEPQTDIIEIAKWKKQNGLPFNMPKIVEMYPDRWPPTSSSVRIPLGIRNKFKTDTPAYFVIFPSFVQKENIKIKTHGTKVWPDDTQVVDWDRTDTGFHLDGKTLDSLSFNQMKDYISALLFRWIFGISDIANRNFIIVGDHVMSIDEEYRDHWDSISRELSGSKMSRQMQKVVKWLNIKDNYSALGVNKWIVPEKYKDRHKIVSTKEGAISIFVANT